MKEMSLAMRRIFENSAIYFNGELLSKELLIRTFSRFLGRIATNDSHSTGLVLHTGSVIFDVVAVVFASISNLLSDDFDSEDVILSLEEGDYVVLIQKGGKPVRYQFCGIKSPPRTTGEYIMLKRNESNKLWVPKSDWRNILPYKGGSTRTDGRGLRKKNVMRDVFLSKVLEVNESKMASITETSTVLISSRNLADTILKGVSFYVDGITVPLLDIITASYYTENNEYPYPGNTGKNDPVIRITSRASVASRLIRNKGANPVLGFIILGEDSILRNYTELPELVNRKSIKYALMMTHIDSSIGLKLAEDYESAALFACTKEFLLSNSLPTSVENIYTNELSTQVDAIIDKTVEPVSLEPIFTWDEYKSFKQMMGAIKNSEFESDDREQFIIQAYSLMNLFQTSIFALSDLEALIQRNDIDITPPSKRIEELDALCEYFPGHIKSHAKVVIDILEDGYLKLYEASPKGDILRDIAWKNRKQKIAIVVPKAYYIDAMKKIEKCNSKLVEIFNDDKIYISTAGKFDNKMLFDVIITVGNYSTKRFDIHRCRAANRIIPIFYEFESKIFEHQEKNASIIERNLNKRAYITKTQVADDNIPFSGDTVNEEIATIEQLDADIEDYILKINVFAGLKSLGFTNSPNTETTDIIAIGSFETGERIFFTKFYRAYVFDETTGEVVETVVEDLVEGDSVVFTQNNDETHDIVDELLENLIKSRQLSDEIGKQFKMSKHWKEVLREYMNRTKSTPKTIANALISNGLSVTEVTVRTWLDIDSHIVGPRKVDSLLQIAVLTEDTDMFENVNDYFNACSAIRHIRREILKEIGKAIISKLNGAMPKEGTLMASVYDRIDAVTKILRLESISYISRTVPVNATNRPLMLKENYS